MTLTPLQRITLTAYLEYGHTPPTWGKRFRRAWRRHMILVGMGVIGVSAFLLGGVMEPAVGFAAFIAGAILGDVGMFRRFPHLWPALAQILDRERIGELLAEDGHGGNPAGSGVSSGKEKQRGSRSAPIPE